MADLFDTLNPVDTNAATPVSDIFDQLNPVTAENKSSSSTPETDKAVAQTAAAAPRIPQDARLQSFGVDTSRPEDLYKPEQHPLAEKIAAAGVEKLGGMIPRSITDVAGMLTPVVPAIHSLITEAHIFKPHFENAKAQLSGEPIPHPEIAAKTFDQFNQDDWIKFGVSNAVDLANAALLRKGMIKGGEVNASRIRENAGQIPATGNVEETGATQSRPNLEQQTQGQTISRKGAIDEKTQEGQAVAGAERPQETQTLAEPAAASVPESASAAEPLLRPTPSGPELNPYFSVDRVPEATGISNERLKQIYGEDAVTVGKGRGAKEWQKIGQADTRDPYAVLTAARATGIASPKDVALLRAEHQRLLAYARNSYGTPAYDMLAQNSADMANAIKGVAHGPASDVFRALQDTDMPRYDSPADFDSIIRERMNRESTPDEHATFKKVSDELRNGYQEVIKTAADAQNNLRRYRSNEVVSFDEAVKHIKDQIESITKDCNL